MVAILRKIYSFFIDILQSLLVAVAVFLVVYIFIARPFQVNGESMFPNFEDKEYVLTNLISERFSDPKKGAVVVFKAPLAPEKDYIKRVIGVAGDKVMIKDGKVYLNGQMLDERAYVNSSVKTFGGSFEADGVEITVPKDSFFVLGDNRQYSSDSREWGFVPKSSIIGDSFFVYWPPGKMRGIKNPYN